MPGHANADALITFGMCYFSKSAAPALAAHAAAVGRLFHANEPPHTSKKQYFLEEIVSLFLTCVLQFPREAPAPAAHAAAAGGFPGHADADARISCCILTLSHFQQHRRQQQLQQLMGDLASVNALIGSFICFQVLRFFYRLSICCSSNFRQFAPSSTIHSHFCHFLQPSRALYESKYKSSFVHLLSIS